MTNDAFGMSTLCTAGLTSLSISPSHKSTPPPPPGAALPEK